MIFYMDIRFAGSYWLYLGHVRRSRSVGQSARSQYEKRSFSGYEGTLSDTRVYK